MSISVVQEPKQVVSSTLSLFNEFDFAKKDVDKFDVLVCGGTLGIFITTALTLKGHLNIGYNSKAKSSSIPIVSKGTQDAKKAKLYAEVGKQVPSA
ncbi:hypothetical protein L2E82_36159 [Cichorium intybus]|uniref:Uncharacterized protein n=1 Tax=Cichorium intybus TaxID=13427 RepID=A0ACB9BQV2_CICIN|nr:hypothetical protein L2E82_36159 [Cichorium intybus]